MSEQAAPATRRYVILELVQEPSEDSLFDHMWMKHGTVIGTTREKAIERHVEANQDWEGGTLVAITEGSWVPTPVKVETKRNVTLG